MFIPKNYFHDRLILLLLSVNSFLAIVGSLLILFRLDVGSKGIYWAQYRANLGINAHQAGSISDILAYIVFLIFLLVMNTLLSMKSYRYHKNYSVMVLGLGSLLMILTIIVSNSLLDLR